MRQMNIYEQMFGASLPGPPFWNKRLESISNPMLNRLQETKLKRQLSYLYRNSKFYQRKLRSAKLTPEDIKTLHDLQRLPFTTKDELRGSLQKAPPFGLHRAARMNKIIRIHASSGTSGQPTLVCLTRNDRDLWTELSARCLYTHGIRRGDIVAFGYSLPLFVAGLPLQEAYEEIGATFLPTSAGMTERLIELIRVTGANVLNATPSYCQYLTEYLREKLQLEPSRLTIRKIKSGAEPGAGIPSVRRRIQEDWNAAIFEGMGNADVAPTIFAECPWQTGMHFSGQGIVLVELIDPETGELVEIEENATGELVYTALDREASPILRFRSGDFVSCWTEPCECGRTGFRIRCTGRTDEMLKIRGVKMWPSALQEVVASFAPRTTGNLEIVLPEGVDSFAVIELHVNVEYGGRPSRHELEDLKRELVAACSARLFVKPSIRLVPDGSFARSEMKSRLVRRN